MIRTSAFWYIPVIGMAVSMWLFGTGVALGATESDGFSVRSEGLIPVEPKPDDLSDRFKFAIGSYLVSDFNSTVSYTDTDLGAGVGINPSQALGLDFEQSVLRIQGYYRFNKAQALTYSWYSINSTGSKTLDEQIEWGDVTIPIGANVQSEFDYDIYKLGYLWTFYHNNKVNLSIGAGLHVTRFKVGLNASATNPPGSSVQDVDFTAPLPVVSLDLGYNITPKWKLGLLTQMFAMSMNEWQGSYRYTTLTVEYRAWEHVALGVGLDGNSLNVKRTSGSEEFKLNQDIAGGMVYIAAYF
jgi:hypothetical protein